MRIKHFAFNPFGVNCFALSNSQGDCILIDPSVSNANERSALESYIKDNHLTVKKVVNTHLHLDHVLGNAFVERTFGVKAEAHEEDSFLLDLQEEQSQMFGLPCDDPAGPLGNFLAEGDTVEVPEIKLHVLHIAGHSPGGIALFCENAEGIPTPGKSCPLLFSGDILFAGSIGRADLFGGDEHALLTGIQKKLFALPGQAIVLPGHGPDTTIENEKRWF